MRSLNRLPIAGLLLAVAAAGLAQDNAPAPVPAPQDAPSEPPAAPGSSAVTAAAETMLDPSERDTLLRLAWHTLEGHLTHRPVLDKDLEAYALTPRLQQARGCFVTLKIGGDIRGLQGEIETTRPLYQQVIVFTRRAATRDPRFLPLTDLDLERAVIEVAVIGRRERAAEPALIQLDRQGLFLEKWGRRALFLPGVAVAHNWNAERTLEELCHQASLPTGGWRQGARIETFETEIISGPKPEPLPDSLAPRPDPPAAAPGPGPA